MSKCESERECRFEPWCRINGRCHREAEQAKSRAIFDAKVRTHGYVDRVTGERVYDPDALGVTVAPAPKWEPSEVQITAALEAACFFDTPQSRKDMHRALLAAASEGSAEPERVEVGRLVLPAADDEYGDPEIDAFMGRMAAVQERIQKTGDRMELAVFVELPAASEGSGTPKDGEKQ